MYYSVVQQTPMAAMAVLLRNGWFKSLSLYCEHVPSHAIHFNKNNERFIQPNNVDGAQAVDCLPSIPSLTPTFSSNPSPFILSPVPFQLFNHHVVRYVTDSKAFAQFADKPWLSQP
jgi:hypothetical protein